MNSRGRVGELLFFDHVIRFEAGGPLKTRLHHWTRMSNDLELALEYPNHRFRINY